jgi:outer membrane protein OmpA-like peptidoglycan-associated protein
MRKMTMQASQKTRSFGCISVAMLLFIAGCAQSELGSTESAASALQTSRAISNTALPEKASVSATVEQQPDYANMNPVPIVFDKLSVKLDDSGKQILAKIGDRAKKSKKLVITAYCDRRQVGNAHAAAKARGSAVREQLIHLGAKASAIRVKIVTETANKHLAEIQFG